MTDTERRKRILLLCTGYSARSQIAEALPASCSTGPIRRVQRRDRAATRNALILGVFRRNALVVAAGALVAMLVASVALAFLASGSRAAPSGDRPLALRSPFSLWSALKFGRSFSECRLPVRLPRGCSVG